MIRAYPCKPSVRPGEEITLHVSTDAPQFRVGFYRQGVEFDAMGDLGLGPLDGYDIPDGPTDQDWGWPGYRFTIPDEWPSGIYIAVFAEVGPEGDLWPDVTTPDGPDAKALFCVLSARPGTATSIAYKVSWATFHAYNATGYGSLYAESLWSNDTPRQGFKVTTRRPGGGTGGRVMPGDSPDHHHPSSPRQTFAHWDAPFIAWLEGQGYALDYCTDYDLHRDPELLAPYNLLLSVGHDEYWSDDMRSHLEAFIRSGGNVAFFSGNTLYWRIHFADDDTAIISAKSKPSSMLDVIEHADVEYDNWRNVDPDDRVTGVTTWNGGGWWDGKRDALGYTVQHAGHWVYDGTDLRDGGVIGADADAPLVGYEADGIDYIHNENGLAVPSGRNPLEFFILGTAPFGPGWRGFRSHAAATMGIYTAPSGGIVFTCGTTDWPIVAPRDVDVGRITRNVIDRLRLRSARILGPLPARGGRMLAAEGETVSFHVDASLPGDRELRYEWTVTGAEISGATDRRVASAEITQSTGAVTVDVLVSEGGAASAFGTQTLLPLTHVDSLRLEICILLRDMVITGDPCSPLVVPNVDPADKIADVVTVVVPTIRDCAARLHEVASELVEIWSQDPDRPPIR